MRFVFGALAVSAALYGFVVLGFHLGQRRLVFPAPSHYEPPAAAGAPWAREAPLRTSDGETIMVWRQDAEPGRPTILFFHGNADSVSNLGNFLSHWRAAGWGAAVVSYRGYPGSTGSPSEDALIADARLVHDTLVAEGIGPDDIVIAGYSLGSGVAVALAAERPARALLLMGAFSAAEDVGARAYPFLPVRTLMKDRFRSVDRIADAAMPVFLVHGRDDVIVPLDLGERLHDAAAEPKQMVVIDGMGHILPPEAGWLEFLAFLDAAGSDAPAALTR